MGLNDPRGRRSGGGGRNLERGEPGGGKSICRRFQRQRAAVTAPLQGGGEEPRAYTSSAERSSLGRSEGIEFSRHWEKSRRNDPRAKSEEGGEVSGRFT